jgi:hypothetical protein
MGLRSIGVMIAVSALLLPAAAMADIADADGYADGTILDNVFPGVTLSSVHTSDGHVYALTSSEATTGSSVFAHLNGMLWDNWGDGIWEYLRADFAPYAVSVSVDFAADNGSDRNAELLAYDSGGSLVDSDFYGTPALGAGQYVTLSVSAPEIAYVLCYGDNVARADAWVLDNMVFEPIPAPGAFVLGGVSTRIKAALA